MTLEEARRHQLEYLESRGGITRLREADQQYNDTNRDIISAFAECCPEVYLGNFYAGIQNFPILTRLAGSGEDVENFGCDFVIPVYDASIIAACEALRLHGYNPKWVNAVWLRVTELGGEFFTWL